MDINILPLLFFAFVAYLSMAFAGFGGIIIPITLGAHFYPMKWMITILVPLVLLSNVYIIILHHRYIDWQVLLKKVLPLMFFGLVIGIVIFNWVQGDLLKKMLGVLVVFLSSRELYFLYGKTNSQTSITKIKSGLYIFSAGIVHGVFASGGPLLVYALSKINLLKSVFRSTLAVVWFTMNILLIVSYIFSGRLNAASIKFSLMCIPSLVLGLLIGDFLHHRVDEKPFKVFVFIILTLSGFSIVIK